MDLCGATRSTRSRATTTTASLLAPGRGDAAGRFTRQSAGIVNGMATLGNVAWTI